MFGDPVLKLAIPDKPDFVINQNDISITPENPLTTDTVKIKIRVNNLGRIFQPDSVDIELFASSSLIHRIKWGIINLEVLEKLIQQYLFGFLKKEVCIN